MAELQALAGGRADLLAEVAGIFEGTSEGELDEVFARSAARLCRMAGADLEAIPAWVEEGRRRRASARLPPFSAPLRRRPGFEILDDFRWTGDDDDRVLWREYEHATKGRQAITWSKGLRQLLAVTERTDEEIAAEEIGGEDLAVIHGDDWRRIVQIPGLTGLILDQVERGGLEPVP